MRIYSNAYNCAIYLKLLVFFARFKHTVKKYDYCAYILIIIKRFYHLNIYNKKIYKKNLPIWYKKIVFVYSINMQNLQQNSEIMYIKNEINLLQDLLKKTEKIQYQFQNVLARIGNIRVKKGQGTNLFKTRKIQNIVRNIFQNKIKQIKKNTSLLQNTLTNVKKKKEII